MAEFPSQLPVFRLTDPQPPMLEAYSSLMTITGFLGKEPQIHGDWWIFRDGSRRLDINRRTREVWYADQARLWKPPIPDTGPPGARDDSEQHAALPFEIHPKAFTQNYLVPFDSPGVTSRLVIGPRRETFAARTTLRDRENWKFDKRTRVTVDWHVPIVTELNVSESTVPGYAYWVPLVGPRVQAGVTFAPEGMVIGFHGSLTTASEAPEKHPSISLKESLEAFRQRFQHMNLIEPPPPTLAFEVCETGEAGTTLLIPVWLHRGTVVLSNGQLFELPIISLPASRFDAPSTPTSVPFAGSGVPVGSTGLTTGAWWVESANDRIYAQQNAEAYAAVMEKMAKWKILKVKGDDDGLREDWLSNAASGIELTDLAYYAGHASTFGWHFNKGLSPSFAVEPKDVGKDDMNNLLIGHRVKWIAICACGPLQDGLTGCRGVDVFDRWGRIFDGLHTLLGFADRILPRPEMGVRFANHLQTHTVIDAWLRAARETGIGSGVYAAAMYASKGTAAAHDPLLDSVEYGSTRIAEQSKEPDTFTTIWTPA